MSNPLPGKHCPHCGVAWPPGADTCPRCALFRGGEPEGDLPPGASWPPAPTGQPDLPPPPPPPPRLVTGAAWGDVTLGLGMSLASNFLYCLGFLVMPILYFSFRAQFPHFARGIGYGFLGGVALLLGAFAWCLYGINR